MKVAKNISDGIDFGRSLGWVAYIYIYKLGTSIVQSIWYVVHGVWYISRMMLHSGSKAQDKTRETTESTICRILLFMWSFGSILSVFKPYREAVVPLKIDGMKSSCCKVLTSFKAGLSEVCLGLICRWGLSFLSHL